MNNLEIKKEAALPSVTVSDLFADSGMGFEGMGAKDIAIPFTAILQGLSPQVKRGPSQIVGAREGDIFNSISQEVVSSEEGIVVVPCAFQKRWVEWVPRDSGGGFVQQHDSDEILKQTTKDDKNRDVLPNKNLIVTTAYYYVLVVNKEGNFYKSVISMTSTNLKKSRRWNSQMGSIQVTQGNSRFNPPMFSHSYLLKTVMETKDANSWFTWDIQSPTLIAFDHPDLYQAARRFSMDVNKGLVKAPEPAQAEEAPVTSGESKHF